MDRQAKWPIHLSGRGTEVVLRHYDLLRVVLRDCVRVLARRRADAWVA